MTASKWQWVIELDGMVGAFAHVETVDGSIREGKITKVETREVRIDGAVYPLPYGIELNGDPTDVLTLAQIRELQLS